MWRHIIEECKSNSSFSSLGPCACPLLQPYLARPGFRLISHLYWLTLSLTADELAQITLLITQILSLSRPIYRLRIVLIVSLTAQPYLARPGFRLISHLYWLTWSLTADELAQITLLIVQILSLPRPIYRPRIVLIVSLTADDSAPVAQILPLSRPGFRLISHHYRQKLSLQPMIISLTANDSAQITLLIVQILSLPRQIYRPRIVLILSLTADDSVPVAQILPLSRPGFRLISHHYRLI